MRKREKVLFVFCFKKGERERERESSTNKKSLKRFVLFVVKILFFFSLFLSFCVLLLTVRYSLALRTLSACKYLHLFWISLKLFVFSSFFLSGMFSVSWMNDNARRSNKANLFKTIEKEKRRGWTRVGKRRSEKEEVEEEREGRRHENARKWVSAVSDLPHKFTQRFNHFHVWVGMKQRGTERESSLESRVRFGTFSFPLPVSEISKTTHKLANIHSERPQQVTPIVKIMLNFFLFSLPIGYSMCSLPKTY